MSNSILIDLNRCTGCWTCSIVCKSSHELSDDEFWVRIETLGDGSGIDRPSGVWPNLKMSWLPIHTKKCTGCADLVAKNLTPTCVYNCLNAAMAYGDPEDEESDVSKRLAECREKGLTTFELPSWQDSKDGVIYVARK